MTIGVVRGELISGLHGKGDPYVVVLCGKKECRTQSGKATSHPVWNEEFVFKNVNDTNAESITFLLHDEYLITRDNLIATATLSAGDFPSDDKTHATILLTDIGGKGKELGRLEVDVLVEEQDEEGHTHGGRGKNAKEGETRAVIVVKNGEVNEKQDLIGTADPFVKIYLGCAEQRTLTKNNTLSPIWNQKLYFENITKADAGSVRVVLYDEDPTKDEYIGEGTVSILEWERRTGRVSVVMVDAKKKKEQGTVELEVRLETDVL